MAKDPRYPVPQEASLLPLFGLLTGCHQKAERLLSAFVEPEGLTPSQFDVLATLGDLPEGLNFKALSQQSLITGGTLTPVLGRLESKGLVRRCKSPQDSRQTMVWLSEQGQGAYEKLFLPFVDLVKARQDAALSAEEQAQLALLLGKLSRALD